MKPQERTKQSGVEPHFYRVSELVAGLKNLLANRVGCVWVSGEVSTVRAASSGHSYFVLKDATAQLRAVLFLSAARKLSFDLQDGQEVLVYGEVTLYDARGDLQIIVRQIEPRGRGALQLAIEQLRARLEKEGLFDKSHKRVLSAFPRRVGVVTSQTGAALQDVLEVSRRRFPSAKLILSPTRVQGAGAENEIAQALRNLYALHATDGLDVILLVRGGGSFEDLYSFSTEVVARAVYEAPVPVVTGIGHEIDVSIADLVADVRAPTPSAAMELALPDRIEILARLYQDADRLLWAATSHLRRVREKLAHRRTTLRSLSPRTRLHAQRAQFDSALRALLHGIAKQHLAARGRLTRSNLGLRILNPTARLHAERQNLGVLFRSSVHGAEQRHLLARQRLAQRSLALRMLSPTIRLRTTRQRLDVVSREIAWRASAQSEKRRARLAQAAARLDALSPLAVLSRGYAIVRRLTDGAVLSDVRAIAPGEALRIRVANGEVDATVTAARKLLLDSETH